MVSIDGIDQLRESRSDEVLGVSGEKFLHAMVPQGCGKDRIMGALAGEVAFLQAHDEVRVAGSLV